MLIAYAYYLQLSLIVITPMTSHSQYWSETQYKMRSLNTSHARSIGHSINNQGVEGESFLYRYRLLIQRHDTDMTDAIAILYHVLDVRRVSPRLMIHNRTK